MTGARMIMRVDLAGLLRNAATALRHGDEINGPSIAFALEKMAKHVELIRSGEATLAEFCDLYRLPEPGTAMSALKDRGA